MESIKTTYLNTLPIKILLFKSFDFLLGRRECPSRVVKRIFTRHIIMILILVSIFVLNWFCRCSRQCWYNINYNILIHTCLCRYILVHKYLFMPTKRGYYFITILSITTFIFDRVKANIFTSHGHVLTNNHIFFPRTRSLPIYILYSFIIGIPAALRTVIISQLNGA